MRILQEQGHGSCAQLAAAVGVSRVTAHEELRKLREAGEIRIERVESSGGRPGQVYAYSGGHGQRLGVLIDRKMAVIHVQVAQVGMNGEGRP